MPADCQITIPSDTVIGTKRFGGFVYSISVDFGGTESASTLRLSIVSEGNGGFSRPNLNLKSLESIAVGNGRSFKGYPLSYSSHKLPDRRILEVSYIDGSALLDRYVVGLTKRYKDKPGIYGNLIVVGKEYHPCDSNFDSTVSYAPEEGGVKEIDWCDPCPFCPPTKYSDSCLEANNFSIESDASRANGNAAVGPILPVKYTFNELLHRLKDAGINSNHGNLVQDAAILSHAGEYSGSLRSVLSSWCGDFGLSFYWDFFDNSLNFIDLKQGVQNLFDPSTIENLTQLTEGETLENTRATSFLSYYEKDGGAKTYSCADDMIVGCLPLFYKDILDESGNDEKGLSAVPKGSVGVWDTGLAQKELACALAYYDQSMWNSFLFFNAYNIWDPERAIALSNSGTVLRHLGNMQILGVTRQDGSGSKQSASKGKPDVSGSWASFLGCLSSEMQTKITSFNADEKNKANNEFFYFAVVRVDQIALAKRFDRDQEIARDFMGKYWYRIYSPAICGGTANTSDVSIQAADGASASFHTYGESFSGSAISKFGYSPSSKVGKMVKQQASAADKNKLADIPFEARQYAANTSFILVEKEAFWYPNSGDTQDYESVFNWFKENMSFNFVGAADGRHDLFLKAYPPAKDDQNIRLILCKSINENMAGAEGGLAIRESKIENFYEASKAQDIKRSQYADRTKNPTRDVVVGQIGLRSRDCKWVNYHGFGFMMPVGASYYALTEIWANEYLKYGSANSPTYALKPTVTEGDRFNGLYSVRVSQSFSIETYLPKAQLFYGNPSSAHVRHHEVLQNTFDENINRDGFCGPDTVEIEKRHKNLESFVAFSNTEPQKTLTFSVVGVYPQHIPISQGLDSFSISFDDSGITTQYSISTKYAQPLPIDTVKRAIDKLANAPALKAAPGPRVMTGPSSASFSTPIPKF